MNSHEREATMHRRALERIANHPAKIGIKEKVIGVCVEKRLYEVENGARRLIAEPDVIFEFLEGGVEIIEYKNNGNGAEKANEQLRIAGEWYARHTSIPLSRIRTRIVHGDAYPFLKR